MTLWVLLGLWGCEGSSGEPAADTSDLDPSGDSGAPVGDDDDDVLGDDDDDVEPTACALGPYDLHTTLTMSFEGSSRSAIVDLPADYDGTELLPLVLNFHGLSTTAQNQKTYTGMAGAANARGWIAVHPDGTNRSWDYLPGSQDIRFVTALLDELERRLCVDSKQVYFTGLSNGAYFSYQFACDRGDRVTAIAPVAGTLTAASFTCDPGVKIPLLHIHGTDDRIVQYEGSALYKGARESVEVWAEQVNDCVTNPVVSFSAGDVTCETWSCSAADSASLCTVEGGGHTWPGALYVPGLGAVTDDIDATDEILDFFGRWRRP